MIKLDIKKNKFKDLVLKIVTDCFVHPLQLLVHPIRGFDEFKREKTSHGYVAWYYLIMMIFAQIIAYNFGGFLVNKNNPNDFNLFLTIAIIVFPVVLFTVGNWASTALMDGKGTMQEIFRVICYSFFPFVWLNIFASIMSNFITVEELALYSLINGIGIFLMGYMIFFGLLGIHEYGLFKTILMFAFTILAVAVILFIMLLFLSLINQVYSFLDSVYEEFRMRYL